MVGKQERPVVHAWVVGEQLGELGELGIAGDRTRNLAPGMSHRLRVMGLLVFAILVAAIGYRMWALRRVHAEVAIGKVRPTSPPMENDRAAMIDHPRISQAIADRTSHANAIAVSRSKRLSSLRLPEALQRPGVNTVGEVFAQWDEMVELRSAEYFQALLLFCLENDRAGTADLAASLGDERWRNNGLAFALLHWAEVDPTAALLWAANHPRGENDHSRYHYAFEGYAGKFPLEALHSLSRDDLASDLDALTAIVTFHLHHQNRLGDARAWIETLPEGNLRELLVQRMVHFWALSAPSDAVNWLATTASDQTFRAGMGALVHTLVEEDPRFAAGLTQRFADPQIRQGYLADVIYLWAKRDLGSAVAWLREQPPGPQLDPAIARLVETIAPNDPGEARQWANAISDPKKRDEVLQQLDRGK
jgi:hypothetical protein